MEKSWSSFFTTLVDQFMHTSISPHFHSMSHDKYLKQIQNYNTSNVNIRNKLLTFRNAHNTPGYHLQFVKYIIIFSRILLGVIILIIIFKIIKDV